MDLVYIPQLEGASGFGAPSRYLIVRAIPDGGRVELRDRCVTRIEAKTSDPLELVFPPVVPGAARDFFVRLVVTADEVPEVTFAPGEGESVSFENAEEGVLACDVGINVFAFTENDEGIFLVNRKQVDIDLEVEFDPCGGELDPTKYTFKLGAQYGTLPKPTMEGQTFLGWYTKAQEGVKVTAGDRCKTGVTRLFAQWERYVDPFVDHICPKKNITFFSEDVVPWFVDAAESASGSGSARSGAISDSGHTSLTATVRGRGTFSFKWKVSSEEGYDKLHFIADGIEVANISGTTEWATYTLSFAEEGAHPVEWKYDKDGSVANGSDCGWIDDVVWTPES